jgi:putative heme-binding domain-containing protein
MFLTFTCSRRTFRFLSHLLILCLPVVFLMVSCGPAQDDAAALQDPKIARLKLPEGFKAERLYGPSEHEEGSWVSMTFDAKGRLLASDQYGAIYRLTIPAIGDTTKTRAERIDLEQPGNATDTTKRVSIGYAHGLLWAFNSLFVVVNHHQDGEFEKSSGLYRLQDTDGNDQFDKITLLKTLRGAGEHGPHNIILAPDKKSMYLIAGNYTNVPPMDSYRLPSNWGEDNLFPLITDPNGHAAELKAPGGWIAHIDSTGTQWELVSAGYRNPFDLAFNAAGDLFTYDSDMEWDFGLPWYRPTRICHATSGSEYGWRTGNSVWAPYFADNLSPVLNIGQGSPTNLVYGGSAHFPEKYKDCLFAFDWSFGIIYAIYPEADGASYKARGEEFLSGTSLPLTDGVIGPDGALYFLTGGRRLESDLYRVYYTGSLPAPEAKAVALSEVQKLRRRLETFHAGVKEGAVEEAWPHLKHEDRFIRYAARIAIEHQPVAAWQTRVLEEKDPVLLTYAAMALARQGNRQVEPALLEALMRIPFATLTEPQQADVVRAFELVLARMGMPQGAVKTKVTAYLNDQYPAGSNTLNRALCKVLVYLDAPGVVEKTMTLLETAKDDPAGKTLMESSDMILRNPQYGMAIADMLSSVPPAQQTYYATALSAAKNGWSADLRKKYFEWFYHAFSYKGGHSFRGYIDKARTNALQNVPVGQFTYYNKLSGDSLVKLSGNILVDNAHQPKGPGREWSVQEALLELERVTDKPDFVRGRDMFAASLCIQCHTFKGEGGVSGPDLTQTGTRFSTKDILEAIIEPSLTISDQYGATVFVLKDGTTVLGRLIREDATKYYIAQNPFAPQVVRELAKETVARTRLSEVSPMVPGLINRLNREELNDLVNYLKSGGNENHDVYTGKKMQ